jgi:Family of unknown function (DUF5995)
MIESPYPHVTTMDDVVATLNTVIDWSVLHRSRIGYFAAIYKRVQLQFLSAADAGLFDDPEQMKRLGVAFANRYFTALVAYHNGSWVPLVWRLSFDAHLDPRLSVVQQVFLPMNAHICYDLAPAVTTLGHENLPALRNDFDRLNTVVIPTYTGFYDAVVATAPLLGIVRRWVPYESEISHAAYSYFRTMAWRCATALVKHPRLAPVVWAAHTAWASTLAIIYRSHLLTPLLGTLIDRIEHCDVVATIRALECLP